MTRAARPTSRAARRRRARAFGRGAETVAAWWLRLKGYRVLARDLRLPFGEIDLVARRGRILAVVEVKARPTLGAAREALSARQRRRIERATAAFVQRRPDLAGLDVRFDVLLVAPGHRPRHLADAWRGEGAWRAGGPMTTL